MLGQGSLGGLACGQPEEFAKSAVQAVATVTIALSANTVVSIQVPSINVEMA